MSNPSVPTTTEGHQSFTLFLALPPELRLEVYKYSLRPTTYLLPISHISISYADTSSSLLRVSHLVRTEAHHVVEKSRLDIPPTLLLLIDLPSASPSSGSDSLVDSPKVLYLSFIVGMLLSGYSKMQNNPSAHDVLTHCAFWLDDEPMSGWRESAYTITHWSSILSFHRTMLHRIARTRVLTLCLWIYTPRAQEPGWTDVQRLVEMARSYDAFEEREIRVRFVLLVEAPHVFFFEHLGCVQGLYKGEPLCSVRAADGLGDHQYGAETVWASEFRNLLLRVFLLEREVRWVDVTVTLVHEDYAWSA